MATSSEYPIPAAPARAEIRVVNSTFIGSANYTPGVEAARAFIAAIRAEMPDARHHAYAYLVGTGDSHCAGMSDDGEPSGTAGRPMLAIVRGSGLGDVAVVVTRFFGGTLLGTGGLVHAYSDATRAVLDVLPRTMRVERHTLHLSVAYRDYATARRLLDEHDAHIEDETFADCVTLHVALPVARLDACATALAEATAGHARFAPA